MPDFTPQAFARPVGRAKGFSALTEDGALVAVEKRR
jgi:hypothetical protein